MADDAFILDDAWVADVAAFGSEDDVVAIGVDILNRHAEPQRHYHGQSHLIALVALMDKHAAHILPSSAPRLAIWWHDAIYNPQARDNEERSANLAREHLSRLGAPPALIEETCRIILMTKNHWTSGSAGDGDYFLDADIAILGAPPATYDAYAAAVRQEYAWAPDPAYIAGRSVFLQGALARRCLFRTDGFEGAYAPTARANMQRELDRLGGQKPNA
jgi:predicted metal-dependent HD superfamily phosphohydrolase